MKNTKIDCQGTSINDVSDFILEQIIMFLPFSNDIRLVSKLWYQVFYNDQLKNMRNEFSRFYSHLDPVFKINARVIDPNADAETQHLDFYNIVNFLNKFYTLCTTSDLSYKYANYIENPLKIYRTLLLESNVGFLFSAVKNNNIEKVKNYLNENKSHHLFYCDGFGMTLLHWAAHEGHIDMIKLMCEWLISKDDIKIIHFFLAILACKELHQFGLTPVECAAGANHINVMHYLQNLEGALNLIEDEDEKPTEPLTSFINSADSETISGNLQIGISSKCIKLYNCALIGNAENVLANLPNIKINNEFPFIISQAIYMQMCEFKFFRHSLFDSTLHDLIATNATEDFTKIINCFTNTDPRLFKSFCYKLLCFAIFQKNEYFLNELLIALQRYLPTTYNKTDDNVTIFRQFLYIALSRHDKKDEKFQRLLKLAEDLSLALDINKIPNNPSNGIYQLMNQLKSENLEGKKMQSNSNCLSNSKAFPSFFTDSKTDVSSLDHSSFDDSDEAQIKCDL